MLDQLSAWCGVAGLAVTVIFGMGPHMGLKITPRIARIGFFGGILLLIASPLIFLFQQQQAAGLGTSITGNQNIVGNSGIAITGNNNAVLAQLPPSKKDRSLIQEQLRSFYNEGEEMARNGPSNDPEAVAKYHAASVEWQNKVTSWLNKNMSTDAANKFATWQTHYIDVWYENASRQVDWERNYISALCANLEEMIQSDKWDKPDALSKH